VNDARVLDKEKRNPRWGENEHFKMYMLIPEEWNGWAGFCYTLFFIFCCFEMGPAKVGISRRLSSSSPGTVIKTAWFCVTLFFLLPWDGPFSSYYGRFLSRIRVLLPLFLSLET
jgi:hypothetical protein